MTTEKGGVSKVDSAVKTQPRASLQVLEGDSLVQIIYIGGKGENE